MLADMPLAKQVHEWAQLEWESLQGYMAKGVDTGKSKEVEPEP